MCSTVVVQLSSESITPSNDTAVGLAGEWPAGAIHGSCLSRFDRRPLGPVRSIEYRILNVNSKSHCEEEGTLYALHVMSSLRSAGKVASEKATVSQKRNPVSVPASGGRRRALGAQRRGVFPHTRRQASSSATVTSTMQTRSLVLIPSQICDLSLPSFNSVLCSDYGIQCITRYPSNLL